MSKTFAAAIFEAEKHSKKDPKVAALSGLAGDELRLVCEALNPYRVFNLTLKTISKPATFAAVDAPYDAFFELLDKLDAEELTGNAKYAAVPAILTLYTPKTAEALVRVLNKDLKCGATASTFRKIYPGLDIPDWDIMGAEKMVTPKEAALKKLKAYVWEFPCILESKYDGNRSVAIVELSAGKVTHYSRNGLVQDAYTGVFKDEMLALAKLFGNDMVVDGEILAESFQATQKAKGKDNDKSGLKFYAFDWMSLEQWKARNCPMIQVERSAQLKAWLDWLQSPRVVKSKSCVAHNYAQAFDFYNEVLEEGKNGDGTLNGLGEGLIVKRANNLYEWNMSGTRSDAWTKWKPVLDFDLTIVGFQLGDEGTKNFDKLGALVCEGKDENGNLIKTNVGGLKVADARMKPFLQELAAKTGVNLFEDKKPDYVKNKDQWLRQYIWNHQNDFLGMMIMIEAQEMTRAEDADCFSLRFPQFVCPRPDKQAA